ncbi:MAG: holo-ACP synthase [Oscillospiraceae bacterium]|nr:holo-ACP synthase [Ruminococcus sp.]MCD8346011.1 holo-ACP synthase [Oscillospiraceae bacterium]
MRVGIDCVDIPRIEKSMEIQGFLERIFSENELKLFTQRKMNPQTIAANFAAKEAFSKSLGTGIRGFKLKEVSVLRDELGAPYIELSGKALEIAKSLQFTVSITHTDTVATAIVIAY